MLCYGSLFGGGYTKLQGLCRVLALTMTQSALSLDPGYPSSLPPHGHSLGRKLPLDNTWRVRSADQLSGSAYKRENNFV